MSDPIEETPGRLLYSNSLPRLSFLALVVAGIVGALLAQAQPFETRRGAASLPLHQGPWPEEPLLRTCTERFEYRLENAAGEVQGSARLEFSRRPYERPGFPGHGQEALIVQCSISRKGESTTQALVLDANQVSRLWNLRLVRSGSPPAAIQLDARFEGGRSISAFWASESHSERSKQSPWPILQVLTACRAGLFSEKSPQELQILPSFPADRSSLQGADADVRLEGTVLAANEARPPSPCRDWRLSQRDGGAWRFLLNPDRSSAARQIEDPLGERWILVAQSWVAPEAELR